MWPTLWALWDAAMGVPPMWILTVFVLGVVLMRSAGCVINDYADRHWDGAVERTQNRPLVTGQVTEKQALWLFAGLCAVAFGLVLTLNVLTIQLSFAALALATVYPFTKRVTHLPQFVLGAAFSFAIPMAYAAILGDVPMQAWILFGANLAWTVAYDTEYAMVDRADDVEVGIKSTAILFGRFDIAMIALLQTITLALLATFCFVLDYMWFASVVLILVGLMFIHQLWRIRNRDRAHCFAAFRANNRVGMVITVGFIASIYWS
ncbi:4-hydroxybenzoate octaprenyltransferase [Echinimonas agarilytica]|uniref:4-hydroxybenzoate octaprenyltransferase n=1 Tax=Echinimonas agarilytica TaxID=1215918 RepID=A0AA41W9N8_9GAMM|nr:4-hydroxybenzoate octaprenyltransferase [Echinimonas agarilytica]